MKTYYSASEVEQLAQQYQGDKIALALSMLPEAATLAVVPVSNFKVGAIVISADGSFYFGANQECAETAMAQTIHAEQSALMHAWSRGATNISDVVVNYTPCGHCRQFMNELRSNKSLRIHLPHSRDNLLHQYLPDSFGPSDLEMEERLMDVQQHSLTLAHDELTPVMEAALAAANRSYAPYTHAFAGVALQCDDGEIFTGSYAENAAYNPTMPPLQAAINVLRLSGRNVDNVNAIALVCGETGGHEKHTQSFWSCLSNIPVQVGIYQSAS